MVLCRGAFVKKPHGNARGAVHVYHQFALRLLQIGGETNGELSPIRFPKKEVSNWPWSKK